MRCLFNVCYDKECEKATSIIIRERGWKYGLCEEHYELIRKKK